PRPERLVIRPPKWEVGTMVVVYGIVGVAFTVLGFYVFLHSGPDLASRLILGVPALLLAALPFAMIPLSTRGTLWADAEWVGVRRPGLRVKCRRDELGSLQLGQYISRQGTPCSFLRKDRSVAFTTTIEPWTRSQIAALAKYLGVPLTDARDPVTYACPVCGYPGLEEPAYSGAVASHEICPSCGFEFGGPADPAAHEAWRQQWIAGGMTWWAQAAGRPAPANWDPAKQLAGLSSS
ncbi:MAG TPA: hypothetical protein VG104_12955, partial [Candidatus Dormibacteraeota bacterium]|nr:hypothetical protein [Candidatus Dormibacteraeota bacterium]